MIVNQQKEIRDKQELINSLNETKEKIISLEQRLSDKQCEIDETKKHLSKLLLSKSWTITRPLRKVLWKSDGEKQ